MKFRDMEVGECFVFDGDLYVKINEIQLLHTPLAKYNAVCWGGKYAGELAEIDLNEENNFIRDED